MITLVLLNIAYYMLVRIWFSQGDDVDVRLITKAIFMFW